MKVDLMARPAAFDDGSETVWMDSRNRFDVFEATSHPTNGKKQRYVLSACKLGKRILTPLSH